MPDVLFSPPRRKAFGLLKARLMSRLSRVVATEAGASECMYKKWGPEVMSLNLKEDLGALRLAGCILRRIGGDHWDHWNSDHRWIG
jgi:hypothetical protein